MLLLRQPKSATDSSMAGPDYNLNTSWTQHQSNPQLENEFDPNAYNVVADSTQRFGRRQGAQDLSYPPYQQQYAAAPQQTFTFSVPSRVADPAFDGSFFDQQAGTSSQPQDTSQFAPQRSVYGGPSSSLQGAHIAPGMYRGNSQGYSYPQHAHQPGNMGLGQPQGPIESSGVTPTHHEFDAGSNTQQGQQHPPSVFVSPPPNNSYDHLYQSPPQDRPVDPQLGAHPANLSFYGQSDTVQDVPAAPSAKRQRGAEDATANYSGDGADQDPENKGEAQKSKPAGACARCKGLKVRCEFITDPDICKRCLNGGHECVIPGRKKRRPPPKREHLLSQIREQATQINTLMAKLEEANLLRSASQGKGPSNAPSPTHSATNTDRLSSVSLPTSSSFTSLEIDDASERSTSGDHIDKPDVLDWIAKARASLEEFGGYLSMGGPSATREMLGGDEDDFDGNTGGRTPGGGGYDEFEFAILDDEDAGTRTELGLTADGGMSDHYLSGDEGSTVAGGNRRHLLPPRSATPSEASFRRASTTDQLASIPNAAAPIGFFAQLMAQRRRRGSRPSSDIDEDDRGLANEEFFKPSPVPNRSFFDDGDQAPRILKDGVVSPREVEDLFKIYWDYMNLSVSLLDPELYTSQKTFVRSPFLFTVICGIASKYYKPRPDLYQKLMRYARQAAGEALIGGRKSVEVVHSYILLALYPVPCRRWEDDRSWVYLGLAIRIASDLNLHHPNTATPKNEQHARAMLNRTRAWLNCFNLDRSTGSQYGKPPTINNSDYMANHSGEWWNSSQWNLKNYDIHIAGYNAELRIMARFSAQIRGDPNNPSGIDKTVDAARIALETDEELGKLWDTWNHMIEVNNDPNDAQGRFRNGLLRLAYSYARLTALSWGFQLGFGRKGSASTDRRLLWSAYRAAKDTVQAYVDHVGIPSQRIYLRHGPEAQSVFITFACAFLIKLMQPKFDRYLMKEHRVHARELVQKVVDVLGSPEVAVDDGHYPKLYSRFLKGLLDTSMADVNRPDPIIKQESPINEQHPLAKAKSVSPATQTHELFRSTSPSRGTSSTPSSARASQTPPPQGSDGFDSFMPMNPDPYANSMLLSAELPSVDNQFFSPLLPFDSELLQSMQTLSDPVAWPEMIMPGFAWMNGRHQNDYEMS